MHRPPRRPTRTALAMKIELTLYRRQTELLCNLGILDVTRLVQRHALDAFRHVRTRRDRRSAAKRFELDIGNDAVFAYSDLELHYALNQFGAEEKRYRRQET